MSLAVKGLGSLGLPGERTMGLGLADKGFSPGCSVYHLRDYG